MSAGEFKMIEHDGVLYRPEDFDALGLGKAEPSIPVEDKQPEATKAPAKKAPAKKTAAKKAVTTKAAKPANKAATPDGDKKPEPSGSGEPKGDA